MTIIIVRARIVVIDQPDPGNGIFLPVVGVEGQRRNLPFQCVYLVDGQTGGDDQFVVFQLKRKSQDAVVIRQDERQARPGRQREDGRTK
jgi:hypothetical protein